VTAVVVGLGGGSAAGKSHIAAALKECLAPLTVEIIGQDRYFRQGDDLPRHRAPNDGREWPDHNHPDSFDFPRLRADVREAGDSPADVVIVEGILVLHDAELRQLMDLKLFVEADADERIVRRIRRNVARNYDLDGICDFYLDSVRYRHREFCEPTKSHADLIIPGGAHQGEAREACLTQACDRIRSLVEAKRSAARE
jgi:uridine kinase